MDKKKKGMQRRQITLHSFRRFTKTVISNQANQDYSEWFLGHSKSSYYTTKEPERRQIYADKCMKYLTFLDYSTLETTGKNIEAQLIVKDNQITALQRQVEELKQSTIRYSDVQALRDEFLSFKEDMRKKANEGA